MTEGDQIRVTLSGEAPDGWSALLTAQDGVELSLTEAWTTLAARHYPASRGLWITADLDGLLAAGMPLLARRRQGLERLESSFDGTAGGVVLHPDLEDEQRRGICRRLVDALDDHLGGLTALAAVSGVPAQADLAAALERPGWQRQDYQTALVDCRRGPEHVEVQLWTNNRRNERNRGLKRGCTLHSGGSLDDLERWYPLYLQKSRQWAQAEVPLGFFRDLVAACPEQTVLDTVRLEGELVGGHFCFVAGDRLVAWQGAVQPELSRRYFLTPLLYWRNILTACEWGLDWVDFGGCVGRDSLWDFKRRCGAQASPRVQWIRRTTLGRVHRVAADMARRLRGGGR